MPIAIRRCDRARRELVLEPWVSKVKRRDVVRTDWKVYKAPDKPGKPGEFTAATKNPTEAALLVGFLGDGSQIKYRHHTLVWTEGKESFRATDSYDLVAHTCLERVATIRREAFEAEQRRQFRRMKS